ncbi:MAG: trypsin-like peptidase domain-containing protein [Verrucomicrobiota bacterium JB023]|nr:trypsin-like peptidase domain-containing protein [Verrucomicrobiota bacterium JB023]
MRKRFRLLGICGLSLLLSSCVEDKESKARIVELEDELIYTEEKLADAQDELDNFSEIESELEATRTKVEALEELEKAKQELEEAKSGLEEELKKVKEDFDAYQKKYEAKVRREAEGEAIASITVAGKELKNVVLRHVGESEVKLSHESGFATISAENAPSDWKERFFLRTPEESAAREAAFLADLNREQEAGSEEEAEPTRRLSDYQKRRLEQEAQREAMEKVNEIVEPAVVLIKGDSGTGTGFFAREGITTYLYTAAHVLDRNTGLVIEDVTGRQWKDFGDLEVAEGLDLVRIPVTVEVANVLEIRSPEEEDLVSGEFVAAFGNADGAGVITKNEGRVRGVGPETLEVTSGVVRGDSGGPVVLSDGTVVALITHLLEGRDDVWAETTPSARVRRFACRLDRKIQWKKASLGSFITAQTKIDSYDRVTRLMFALASLRPTTKGLLVDSRVGSGGDTVMDILEDNQEKRVVRELLEMNNSLQARKTNMSERDLRKDFRSYYESLYHSAQKQRLEVRDVSPYHEAEVKASFEWRADALEAMKEAIDNLRE